MERVWFLTWRTYGTWLPGEEGFVGDYRDTKGFRRRDNQRGHPATQAIPPLAAFAATLLTHPAVRLSPEQGGTVLVELLRTAAFRNWEPCAIAVLTTHVHFLFGVPDDPEPAALLREVKSYASRALNRVQRRPKGWWWADGGSTRPVKGDESRDEVRRYIRDQDGAHVIWVAR